MYDVCISFWCRCVFCAFDTFWLLCIPWAVKKGFKFSSFVGCLGCLAVGLFLFFTSSSLLYLHVSHWYCVLLTIFFSCVMFVCTLPFGIIIGESKVLNHRKLNICGMHGRHLIKKCECTYNLTIQKVDFPYITELKF